MRIVSIVGARPQFIKLAPVSRAMADLAGGQIEDVIIHTGQHYDEAMSRVFFDELEIPKPDMDLAVGSGSHGAQTARMLELIENALVDLEPDLVITYGDTNSTVAGSLAAAKLNMPIAHIEAGLRSFNRSMPEEVNRIVTDHISELLFAPTTTAVANLEAENLGERTFHCGDVMLDAVLFNQKIAAARSDILERYELSGRPYAVATVHRPVNTDTDNLAAILAALNDIASNYCKVLFPVHPRTLARIRDRYADWQAVESLCLIEPVGYLDMLQALGNARLALTDSGGLQKEAFFLGTPCVTMRDETEWSETVEAGANRLVPAESAAIMAAAGQSLEADTDRSAVRRRAHDMFGGGLAAENIVRTLLEYGTGSQRRMRTAH